MGLPRDTELSDGDSDLSDDEAIGSSIRLGRGLSTSDIVAVKWKDNNDAILLSNYHTYKMGSVQRWDRTVKKYVAVRKPGNIKEYNKYMGFVDLLDGTYRIRMRQNKWWWPIFSYFVSVAVNNSCILMIRAGHNITLYQFIENFTLTLLKSYENPKRQRKKISGPLKDSSRLLIRPIVLLLTRGMGFMCSCWITTAGKRATPEEAKILVVAHHCAFLDYFCLVKDGNASPLMDIRYFKDSNFGVEAPEGTPRTGPTELTNSLQVFAVVDEDIDQANSQLIKTMKDAAKKANPTCNQSLNKFSATTLSLMNRRNDLIIRNSEDLLEKRDLNKTIHKRQRTETRAYNQRIVETTIKEGKGYKTAKKRLAIVINRYLDPIYVDRKDFKSRKLAREKITKRLNGEHDHLKQIFIFPEGTCTNQSSLITFQQGAFFSGLPVQPVCLKFRNKLQYLPVYVPNEEERRNSEIYANNVRDLMAKHLGVPVLNIDRTDEILISKTIRDEYPIERHLYDLQKLRTIIKLPTASLEVLNYSKLAESDNFVKYERFAEILNVSTNVAHVQQLFSLYESNENYGMINFNVYIVDLCLLSKSKKNSINLAFDVLGNAGKLSYSKMTQIFIRAFELTEKESMDLLKSIDLNENGFLTYNDFIQFSKKKSTLDKLFLGFECNEKTREKYSTD
ncbi:Lysophosphatidylcholine acyltransferase 1 [Nymphon striatum]|nr:Lysophosphatidylcholine acyltransferase 1 [Nymphon striatum]